MKSDASVAELLRKVQRIEITARRQVTSLVAGQYHSVFRGQGMEFDEVREYQPGDDIRAIDWNVTARTGVPFIKRFREERDLTVLFAVDLSASHVFGSLGQSKLDLMAEVVALLMVSALRNQDKVGMLLFDASISAYFPARKGRGNVMRLLRELLGTSPSPQRAQIAGALEFINRVQRRRSVVFLLSDFLELPQEKSLLVTSQRHDLIALSVEDPREKELPNVGFVRLRDAETGEEIEVDTSDRAVRRWYREQGERRASNQRQCFERVGVDRLALSTAEDYRSTLRRFFSMREKRFR